MDTYGNKEEQLVQKEPPQPELKRAVIAFVIWVIKAITGM